MHPNAIKKRQPKAIATEQNRDKIQTVFQDVSGLEQETGDIVDPRTQRRNMMIANSLNRRNDWIFKV